MQTKTVLLVVLFACAQVFVFSQDGIAGQIELNAQFQASSDWGSGYVGSINISNPTSAKTNSWTCSFILPAGHNITSLWGGRLNVSGNQITLTNENWNGTLQPGQSVSIGFCANKPQGDPAHVSNLNATGEGDSIAPPQPPDVPGDGLALSASYSVVSDWGSGYQLSVTLTNGTSSLCESWVCEFEMFPGHTISSLWDGVYAVNGNKIKVVNPSWYGGGVIQPGASVSFGMVVANQSRTQPGITNLNAYGNGSNPNPPDPQPPEDPEPVEPDPEDPQPVEPDPEDPEPEPTDPDPEDPEPVEPDPEDPPVIGDYKVVGYFTSWAIYRNPSFKPEAIAADKITHINYAFAKIDVDGNIILVDSWADVEYRNDWNTQKPYWGNFRQLYDLKQKYPHLKVLISIGGWTLSNEFSPMAANPQARANFIQQCIEFCETYDCFDGIDLDWEYPGFADHNGRPEDKGNFTKLLQEMHDAFQSRDPPLLLTIAAPAGSWHYANIEMDKIHQYLDWINLMTYDFHGPWGGSEDSVTNHQSPLYAAQYGSNKSNVDSAVQAYLSEGVPGEKLVIGMPLYGRSYANANSTVDGLYSTYSGPGSGTTAEKGVRFFSDIKENLLNTYTQYWDTSCRVPYLHNQDPQSLYYNEFISYEDELSINEKCLYIKANNLGGVMLWELGMDTWAFGNWDAMSEIQKELLSE